MVPEEINLPWYDLSELKIFSFFLYLLCRQVSLLIQQLLRQNYIKSSFKSDPNMFERLCDKAAK